VRNEFLKRLLALAEICGTNLSEYLVELYDRTLESDYVGACRAIDQIIVTRKATERFPSVADIKLVMNPQVDPKHEANEAAGRIVQAVNKFGHPSGADAKDFIGELGWLVVQRHGGWSSLCLMLNADNITFFKAQFRDMALSLSARAAAGLVDPPALPKGEKVTIRLKELIDSTVKPIQERTDLIVHAALDGSNVPQGGKNQPETV
jgi:hypothetical protein